MFQLPYWVSQQALVVSMGKRRDLFVNWGHIKMFFVSLEIQEISSPVQETGKFGRFWEI